MNPAESLRLTMSALMETNHDLAIRTLEGAINADPLAVLPRFHLATILASRGLHAQAAEALERALACEGDVDAGIVFLYARQLHLSGDQHAAVREYRHVLELDPACEKAHLYLAQLLASTTDSDEAAVHARRAVLLRPPSSMVLRTEFARTYEDVVGGPLPTSALLDPKRAALMAQLPLGEVIFLHPRAAEVLQESGIQCSECAGYSSVSLGEAASDASIELSIVLNRLTVLMSLEEA